MKKLLSCLAALLIAAVAAYFGIDLESGRGAATAPGEAPAQTREASGPRDATTRDDPRPTAEAFRQKVSDRILVDGGRVVKVLPDDNDGSRHQRFIVQIQPGLTVLVAHNIDLAPRVAGLREGDDVTFKGEYEYSEKGGVVHWTHHDPKGWHEDGWIEHRGQRYQ